MIDGMRSALDKYLSRGIKAFRPPRDRRPAPRVGDLADAWVNTRVRKSLARIKWQKHRFDRQPAGRRSRGSRIPAPTRLLKCVTPDPFFFELTPKQGLKPS